MIAPIEMTRSFAATLTGYREARGWSQSELARRTGVVHSYISRLEMLPDNPNRRVPSHEMVTFLADGLELTGRDRAELFLSAGFASHEMCWPAVLAALDELDAVQGETSLDIERAAGLLARTLGMLVEDVLSGERAGLQLLAARVAGLSLYLVDHLEREHAATPAEVMPELEVVAS